MKLLKFQIASTETTVWPIGMGAYSAGQEFCLTEAQSKKWLSKADLEGGHVLCLGEVQGSDFSYESETIHDYLDGVSSIRNPQSLNLVAYTEIPTLASSNTAGVGMWLPKIDGELVSIEVLESLANMASYNYKFDVTKYSAGVGAGASVLTNLGTNVIPATKVAYVSSAGTVTDLTTNASDGTTSKVTVPAAAASADHLYFGWNQRFDGLNIDITGATPNNAAGTTALLVEYPVQNDDGTTTWTTLTQVADGTFSTYTLAQDGVISWISPANWAKSAAIPGSTTAYYAVRISNPHATVAIIDTATPVTLDNAYIVSRTLDMAPQDVKAGDVFTIDTKTGAPAAAVPIRFWVRELH